MRAPSVVFCPTADGIAAWYVRLFKRHYASAQPFVCLRSPGLRRTEAVPHSVPAIVDSLLRDVDLEWEQVQVVAGYSAAGLIAYELAHALSKRFEPPRLVVLLDTACPLGNAPPLDRQAVLHRRLGSINTESVRRALSSDNAGRSNDAFYRAQEVWASNVVAFAEYMPPVYRGDVTLVASEAEGADGAAFRWAERVGGRFECEVLPGQHGEFLHSAEFARRFAAVVNAATGVETIRMRS